VLIRTDSVVRIYVNPTNTSKATTIFLSGIFIVLINFVSEPSSVKIFFSHEKESKKFCSYHVEQKYIFPSVVGFILLKFSSAIFFFLAGDSIIFFSATMQNLNFFRSARALKYFFQKNLSPPSPHPQIRKWLLPKQE